MTLLRTILFTLLVPGTVAGLIPYVLARRWTDQIDLGSFSYGGLGLLLIGGILYVVSTRAFLVIGEGTPAIWFTKPLRFILGEEPLVLISGGLYLWSRNPMYLGVVTVVLGEAFFSGKIVLFLYTTLLWLFFHLIIIFVEEPHLRKKHGGSYVDYCRAVPRWFGIRKEQM